MSARKLPSYATIRLHYVHHGMTWEEIANRYGADISSAYRAAQYGAKQAGHDWPLVRVTQRPKKRPDLVMTMMVVAEIKHARETLGLTITELAKKSGVSDSAIRRFKARPTMKRTTAEKIMKTIEDAEKAQRIKDNAAHALQCRQEKIRRRKQEQAA